MERQLTMASVPIVRYYDHLRFVYEVESRVRELRGQSEGNGNERAAKQTTAGDAGRDETESGEERTDGGSRWTLDRSRTTQWHEPAGRRNE